MASGAERIWTYEGLELAGFAFRVERPCSAAELLAAIGCSKASRGRMFARGQVILRRPSRCAGGGVGPAEALACGGGRPERHTADATLAAGSRLAAGDVVVIAPLITREAGPANDAPVSLLYEDEFVLAVDKPAGILVHGDGSDAETLTARVRGYLRRLGSSAVPQALQRLDVETSGVVLFSKTEEFQPLFDALVAGEAGEVSAGSPAVGDAGRAGSPSCDGWLASASGARKGGRGTRREDGASQKDCPAAERGPAALLLEKPLRKTYLAVVEGAVPWESHVCDAPIGRDRHDARRMRVSPTGQPSLTWARRLAVSPDGRHTLLQVELGTGRRHQIRVHLASLGFPIAGDALYGRGGAAAPRRYPGAPRGRLGQAAREGLAHPPPGAPHAPGPPPARVRQARGTAA